MKKPLVFITVSITVFLVVSALFLMGALQRLEFLTIDLRYRLTPVRDSSGELPVAVVTLDQNSLKGMGRWPIDRLNYVRILNQINSDGAIGVLMDMDFSSEGPDPLQDDEFAESVERSGKIVIAAQMEEKRIKDGALIRNISVPYPALRKAARTLGSITFHVDPDGVVRRMPRAIDNIDEAYLPLGVVGALMIDPLADVQYPVSSMIDMGALKSGQVSTIPFLKVLEGDFPKGFFRDKVALVGATSADLHDLWLTPVGVVPGVFIQTAVLDTALNGTWKEQQATASTLVMLLVVSLITGWLMGESGWKGGIAILVLFLLTAMLSSFLAAGQGIFLQTVPVILVCLAMYPAQVAVRARRTDLVLARERRKTEAFLSIQELQAAEEKGRETYFAPLILLGRQQPLVADDYQAKDG